MTLALFAHYAPSHNRSALLLLLSSHISSAECQKRAWKAGHNEECDTLLRISKSGHADKERIKQITDKVGKDLPDD